MSIQDNTSLEFFLELEIFQTKVVEKIKTHILCSVTTVFAHVISAPVYFAHPNF